MRRATRVLVVSHGICRIELFDEARAGWRAVLYPPPDAGLDRQELRTPEPASLDRLLREARMRADTLMERSCGGGPAP